MPAAAPSQADQLPLATEGVPDLTEDEVHTAEAAAVIVVQDEVIG